MEQDQEAESQIGEAKAEKESRKRGRVMRRGDIIVNPWVSVDYCGELNPMYATIYLGNNYSLDYKGRKHTWVDKVYKENAEHRCPWKVIGHIDLDDIIEAAIRKAVDAEERSE